MDAVEELLVAGALAALGAPPTFEWEPRPTGNADDMITTLALHRKQRSDRPMRPGGRHSRREMDPHEAKAEILRNIRAVQALARRGGGQDARGVTW